MSRYLLEVLKSDKASATLVTGIISILFLVICLGFGVDIAKNGYLKSSNNAIAQAAAQKAIKTVDTRGSLTAAAPPALVMEYKNQKLGVYTNAATGAGLHADETTAYETSACRAREVTQWNGIKDTVDLPYIVMRFDAERASGVQASPVIYVSEGGAAPVLVQGAWNSTTKYKVMSAEVHEASANLIMGMFGMPCQDYLSKVSAISFGSNEDLTNG